MAPGTGSQSMDAILVLIGFVACIAGALMWRRRTRRRDVLHPTEYRPFRLIDKRAMTVGVACPVVRFRFALPDKDDILNLPIGQHISLHTTHPETGNMVCRSYTPVSSPSTRGYFDIMVKIYPTGVMGQHLNRLEVGKDSIQARGPKGNFLYRPGQLNHICMLCGGSGVTPMFQIMQEIAANTATDRTRVSMIYGNVTEDDIIVRSQLQDIVNAHSPQFSVFHVLNNPPAGWTQGSGFVTQTHVQTHFPAPSTPKIQVLMCGPPPMMSAMTNILTSVGYSSDQIYKF
eukprot:TRINITY_DN5476_c0_g1_i1.p1 TRINITY_DN5476_c0_g1~~TRINITY_DN5476_c0_g1_i1.p1  ORF type:complete len:303 (-),score=49.98 TRINITY_DN5476_c0_g1_i1:37-897(-)